MGTIAFCTDCSKLGPCYSQGMPVQYLGTVSLRKPTLTRQFLIALFLSSYSSHKLVAISARHCSSYDWGRNSDIL